MAPKAATKAPAAAANTGSAKALEVVKTKVDELCSHLPPNVNSQLDSVAKKAGTQKMFVVLGLAGVLLIFVLMCPQTFMLDLVGTGFPVFAGLQMLAADKFTDAPFWTTYWIIFASFKVLMGPLDFVLSFVPFYSSLSYLLKLGFFVWLWFPSTQGATMILEKGLKPFVLPRIPSKAE
eukprot:CAMPEP_0170589748 /NCGR_PEP_ID=MMETSP0224-20130122/11507_1 /TAXON_ID=285029 /ORGANISM="Togula jolla, Strain CCCM 725" /LENGTH=177 /DNA_ID=CAMNT_0010913509 /DNA_START=74 /DNA_END=607 /DNA_ORIENTATION=+